MSSSGEHPGPAGGASGLPYALWKMRMRWAMSWRHRGHECSRSQQPWQQQTWPQGRKIVWGWGRDREGTRRVLLAPNTGPSTAGAGDHPGGPAPRSPSPLGVQGLGCAEREPDGTQGRTRWDTGKDTAGLN